MTTRAVKNPKPKNLPDNHLQGKRLGTSLPCTVMEDSPNDTPTIHGPEDVAKFFLPIMLHKTKEQFMLALLDTKNKIIATPTISIGSLSASVVHPREVFAEAIKYPCASIILVHNHPSGDPTPSREDIAVTERLVKAGKVMDLPVLDHIIIGNKKYCSLKEKGNMG